MKAVFDTHCHYLFKIPLKETVAIFQEEFAQTNTAKIAFLSIPQEYSTTGEKTLDLLQNVKGMFLKRSFFPYAYAFAGLVHPDAYKDVEAVANDFFKQAQRYYEDGFDGIKMLEGYPTFIKYTGQGLDSKIYGKFYQFCEEKAFPITIHIANPDENWDAGNASEYAVAQGRVYDKTYPSKEAITKQFFNVLDRYPKLKVTIAHFGFFSEHYEDAEKFMSYPNTALDLTPGGEQLITMSKNWSLWGPFFEKYQDRIIYGTDYYAFPKDEKWEENFTRRPQFLRDFLETDTEHCYLGERFKGVKIEDTALRKIYFDNAEKRFGKPREIALDYFEKAIDALSEKPLDAFDKKDLIYIQENIL